MTAAGPHSAAPLREARAQGSFRHAPVRLRAGLGPGVSSDAGRPGPRRPHPTLPSRHAALPLHLTPLLSPRPSARNRPAGRPPPYPGRAGPDRRSPATPLRSTWRLTPASHTHAARPPAPAAAFCACAHHSLPAFPGHSAGAEPARMRRSDVKLAVPGLSLAARERAGEVVPL